MIIWLRRLLVLAGIVLIGFLLLPVQALRAAPDEPLESVQTAIILGFGFEQNTRGEMLPGAANRFLLQWVLDQHPQVDTIFAQEGVWVSVCAQSAKRCQVRDVSIWRIDFHDDDVDLHTMDIAVCSLERLVAFEKEDALLVAHDMQLWRAAENFERARPLICPSCTLFVADVPDTPYPSQSTQLRTRFERIFISIDLIARLRDRLFPNQIPATCPMPMPAGQ